MAGNRRSRVDNAKRPKSRRINVQMSEESIQRLMLHAVMTRRNPGDILVELVNAHLREFRVQRNPSARDSGSDRPEVGTDVNFSEATAA
jgi:hypothetical protein